MPARRRELVHDAKEVSERRARRRPVGRPLPLAQTQSGTAADAHLGSGQKLGALRLFPDLHPLRCKGWRVKHRRVWRHYRDEGLSL
jgi:hypothetical protein